MTKEQLIGAMDDGKKVYEGNIGYECYKTECGEYLVTYRPNGYTIGIFHKDGVGMNVNPENCFIMEC